MSGNWFEVTRHPGGITVIAEPGHYEDVRSFLIEGSERALLLDTGMGVGDFKALVDMLTSLPVVVVQSHAHFDHIGASALFDQVLVHEAEADDLRAGYPNERFRTWFDPKYLNDIPLPDGFDPDSAHIPGANATGFVADGDRINIGNREIEVIHTPGHSLGGISLFDPTSGALFPGDAVYLGPMFAFRDTSDPVVYRESLRRLAEYAGRSTTVFPSHNEVPITPERVVEIHHAYEEIWAGKAPDERLDNRDIFRFGDFSFELAPGRYGR